MVIRRQCNTYLYGCLPYLCVLQASMVSFPLTQLLQIIYGVVFPYFFAIRHVALIAIFHTIQLK